MKTSFIKTGLLSLLSLMLASTLIMYPKQAFDASLRGLNIWWEVVFPSLLPFFIISEMLIGFGVVRFIGILLEPLMRPVFRVPGIGGFVLAMGMASGFPAGAKLSANMRKKGQLTRIEAERLASFTNSSNPVFIFGAVSVGFFHNPHLGVLLACAHYGGNLLVGIAMRFYGRKEERDYRTKEPKSSFSPLIAFKEMHKARIEDGRMIGKLLGDAIMSSVQTLFMIGGFMIIFSVLNRLLYVTNITSLIGEGLGIIFSALELSTSLSLPFISGIFEITLGNQLISETHSPLFQQVMLASFVLAFSGLSVQAQVASLLADTDIRFSPFFMARILHAVFSVFLIFLLWNPLREHVTTLSGSGEPSQSVLSLFFTEWWQICITYGPLFTIAMLTIYTYLYSRKIKYKL
ncbi:sporulation integral membrane protein YlbJ [Priestia endophytica]|uniref:sporulation integral membrane protein YlbJ n=1 Tax=Priestia endophytica TaxID=135735 RepID=UPI0022824E12|nr:sporulation integral membrane protein YlbJ [Priestia endophytica]MCY8232720.1 sporulation integral membrane protein YlbJ [Priestia endophytica]